VGLSVLETFVAGEGGIISSSVMESVVETEISLERLTLEACDFCARTFFGVDGVERESRSGTVFDL
jgi:hypothetical protein